MEWEVNVTSESCHEVSSDPAVYSICSFTMSGTGEHNPFEDQIQYTAVYMGCGLLWLEKVGNQPGQKVGGL